MAREIFKRDTLLDLVVNGVPLSILFFFILFFLALPVFGFGGIEAWLHFAVVVVSFVSLAILSYVAAVAIVRAEEKVPVYLPGQANVEGSKPLEEREEALEREEEALEQDEPAGELTDGTDEQAPEASGRADEGDSAADREAAADELEREVADQQSTDEDEST